MTEFAVSSAVAAEGMAVSLDLTTVLLALIPVVGTVLVAYLNSLSKKVDEVHSTVNRNYQTMQASLDKATGELSAATIRIATLTETARGAEVQSARSQGVAEGKQQTEAVAQALATPPPDESKP